jgi:hypothetical protein
MSIPPPQVEDITQQPAQTSSLQSSGERFRVIGPFENQLKELLNVYQIPDQK